MNNSSSRQLRQLTAISAVLLSVGLAGEASAAAVCSGSCGALGANGVVTTSPEGGDYRWVSTDGGPSNSGLGLGGETNGSTYSFTFDGTAADPLEFFFNFVTSDGAGFADYAWVNLTLPSSTVVTLFTARTTPSGSTVPGFGMPPISPGVTIDPASVLIVPGGPLWDPLGGSSGACFSAGCGYTDWVEADYVLPETGTYSILFGVVNWADTAFQTGLAFDGVTVAGVPVDPEEPIPEPATLVLLGLGLAGMGGLRRRKAA